MGHKVAKNVFVDGGFQCEKEGKKQMRYGIREVPHVKWRMNPPKSGFGGWFYKLCVVLKVSWRKNSRVFFFLTLWRWGWELKVATLPRESV